MLVSETGVVRRESGEVMEERQNVDKQGSVDFRITMSERHASKFVKQVGLLIGGDGVATYWSIRNILVN